MTFLQGYQQHLLGKIFMKGVCQERRFSLRVCARIFSARVSGDFLEGCLSGDFLQGCVCQDIFNCFCFNQSFLCTGFLINDKL